MAVAVPRLHGESDSLVGGGGGASGPAAARPAAGRAAAHRLDQKAYNRTTPPTDPPASRIVFLPCRCACRTCVPCGRRYGWRVRQGLLTKRGMYRRPAMLTLTIDRDNFASPEHAHTSVSDGGKLRLLMRHLDLSLWVWVLEFQQKTGTGWPHWHLLVDLDDLPHHRLDLSRAWTFWRDKWGLGGLDLQLRRRFDDPTYAICYVTKYLIKQPELGYPPWVLETKRRIRFFQASGKLGGILRAAAAPPADDLLTSSRHDEDEPSAVLRSDDTDTLDAPKRTRQGKRPFVERMAECEQFSRAFLETPDGMTGELRRVYLGSVDARPLRLAYLARMGMLRAAVEVESHHAEWHDGDLAELRPYMLARHKPEARELVAQLQREIETLGEHHLTHQAMGQRLESLRRGNPFADRAATNGGSDANP